MAIRSRKYRKTSSRKALAVTASSLMLLTIAAPAYAQAREPAEDLFIRVEALGLPVADAELAQIRGKFIKPESISYFGISMITSWQDEFGVTTMARLVFNVDFLAGGDGRAPVPQLLIGWVRDGDPAMDVTAPNSLYGSAQVLPLGSLGETSGAAQANIIAGADNSARNGMQIAIVPASSLSPASSQGLSPIRGTTVQDFADGDRLEFRLGANELGLFLTGNNGADSTLQSAGGDLGRLLQQTVLNSDGNSVLNNTAVIIGTDLGAAGFDAIRATEALSAMKGHGF